MFCFSTHRRHRRRVPLSGLAALLLASSVSASAAPSPVAREASVKAAYVFNFIKFTQWSDALLADLEAWNICVLQAPELVDSVKALEGKRARGHPVHVRLVEHDAPGCQVLLLGEQALAGRDADWLPRGKPRLTVLDGRGFPQAGIMLRLFVQNRKVRFEVDLAPARAAGLAFSAKLLRVAQRVDNRGTAP